MHRRPLYRKVVGLILVRCLHLSIGLDAAQALRRQPVSAVRIQPETLTDRAGHIFDRQRRSGREARAFTANDVIIVELGTSNPDGDVQETIVSLTHYLQNAR